LRARTGLRISSAVVPRFLFCRHNIPCEFSGDPRFFNRCPFPPQKWILSFLVSALPSLTQGLGCETSVIFSLGSIFEGFRTGLGFTFARSRVLRLVDHDCFLKRLSFFSFSRSYFSFFCLIFSDRFPHSYSGWDFFSRSQLTR